MQKICPFLWFDGNAEEAMDFYTSVFPGSRVLDVSRYPKGAPAPEGSLMSATFELQGLQFIALNGGPHFTFTPAISFLIHCATQEEVDRYWDRLSAGGDPAAQQCGWLKDRFGLSWQVVPNILGRLLKGEPRKAQAAMGAMMQMKKLDIAALQHAYDNG
jgi:predicted 3-demethylubiquinone-9 3-methyltransferase (glyoxalase superfamily)